MKYTILTYNIGGYEKIHNIENKKDNVEYIYITDDRSITSNTWNVIYVDNPNPQDNFELCYDIRFNPFRYASNDVVIRIDGSMGITGDTDKLVEEFVKGDYDIALMAHPTRKTMYDEYAAWCKFRQYPIEQANKCLFYMNNMEGYPVQEYKGLYQYNFMIQKKDKFNLALNQMTLGLLRYLAPEGKMIDRLDQTLGSFILNKYFNDKKVMLVGEEICDGHIFTWYRHNTDLKMKVCNTPDEDYLFNELVKIKHF